MVIDTTQVMTITKVLVMLVKKEAIKALVLLVILLDPMLNLEVIKKTIKKEDEEESGIIVLAMVF